MSVPHHVKRARRIKARATPEVLAAFEAGKISPRMADTLLHLTPSEQATELKRRLTLAHEHEAKNRLVAHTIKTYLSTLNGLPPDLLELRSLIKAALA